MAGKLRAMVIVPVTPSLTRSTPMPTPLMSSCQLTCAPLLREFRTTQRFSLAPVMDAGPVNVSLTMSPRLYSQNQPTSHPLMNPMLAMTDELADGKTKMVVLGTVVAFAEGPTAKTVTAITL